MVEQVIAVIGSILSSAVGIISVCIAVATLRQNSKLIEESTRPYIVIFFEFTNAATAVNYLVVKNFGQAGATIDHIDYSFDSLGDEAKDLLIPQISSIEGVFLAPSQKIPLPFHVSSSGEIKGPIHFSIAYHSSSRSYHEEINTRIAEQFKARSTRKINGNADHLRDISYTMQEITERLI